MLSPKINLTLILNSLTQTNIKDMRCLKLLNHKYYAMLYRVQTWCLSVIRRCEDSSGVLPFSTTDIVQDVQEIFKVIKQIPVYNVILK